MDGMDATDPSPGATSTWRSLGGALPAPSDPADRDDLLWQEYAAHFTWYHTAASRARTGHLSLRLVVLLAGAAVTAMAAAGAEPWLTASIAALVVVAEGAHQLFGFHENWISYRSTTETLRRHGMQYAAGVSPYDAPDRRGRLARVLDEVTGREATYWVSSARQSGDPADRTSG